MMFRSHPRPLRSLQTLLMLLAFSCSGDGQDEPMVPEPPILSDEELLDLTQRETFRYFWDYAEPDSGAARERFHPDDPGFDEHTVTTGGTGFGLLAILVGVERNYITRSQAVSRLQQILDFLGSAERFHGAWSHWMNGSTGKVIPFSPLDDGGDLVETAFLCQGLVCIQEYFKQGTDTEKALAEKALKLRQEVEWSWYTQGSEVLYWHWSPNYGFAMNFPLQGYNEVLITYVLAAASSEYGISRSVYESGWALDGTFLNPKTVYGYPLLVHHQGAPDYGGPLFWSHYSYLGLDPNGLSDAFVNYGEVNRNQARINYSYCVDNPKGYAGYGEDCWGLTASYTPNSDGTLGYAAHAPGNDLGVISPTAALASMPYTPVESMRALRYFYSQKRHLLGPAGFFDAFRPGDDAWVARAYLAIDQGPVIAMIENHRTGLLWDLFMQNEDIKTGLQTLGFSSSR